MQILVAPQPLTISIPTGESTLPVVELDKSQVAAKHHPVQLPRNSTQRKAADCSFGSFKEHLGFTAWEFFHAAKKTELLSSFSAEDLTRWTAAFAVEYDEAFVWDVANFRKSDRDVLAVADFDSSRLAGRVGEAIAYLTMVKKWGYVFWDRCDVVWQRAARKANIKHNEQLKTAHYLKSKIPKPESEPDFVFEKRSGEVALMEAKGGFVRPTYNPSAKRDLAKALRQLEAWSQVIAPTPTKSFGIGTYLREESDASDDPSLIAFVDPAGEESQTIRPVELPEDLIRRCNYGAWLSGMGLIASGRALRDLRSKVPEPISLPVVRIMNRDFAVTTAGWRVPLGDRFGQGDWDRPKDLRERTRDLRTFDQFGFQWPFRHLEPTSGWLVVGVEVKTLQLVGIAIHNSDAPVLRQLDLKDVTGVRAEMRNAPWSVMPDGSFVGVLDRKFLKKGFQRRQTFTL